MATRDKYNFTQQTDLWGAIEYKDVPSYSKTSVGTTGNAYLVRNFLKKFFPFLDCTVNKTAGGSVNVKIQKFIVKFTFTEAGVAKEFILSSLSLEDILEPLFEGQGFDGMTDSTYSIPLPKMYNDDGQDVSYGYGYLFVGKGNIDGYYEVDLDQPTVKSGVTKFKFLNPPLSSVSLKENLQEIPQKTIEYIKLGAVVNTNAASPTNNESDLYILERGEENQNTTENGESLTTLEQKIIDFLADKNLGVELIRIRDFFVLIGPYVDSDVNRAMSDLLQKELINNNQSSNSGLLYILTPKGKSYITPKQPSLDNQNDPDQIVFDSKNKSTLTTGDIAAIEFITQNYTILKDMEKESPELYNGISEGLRLIMSLTKGGTGQLEPFKPLENQQQIEDQLKEDDFDLSEVDLEELDLTGLEDDLELNDDELGDFDLTEFNELSDFVESELIPDREARDYAILKTVQLMELSNTGMSIKTVIDSLNTNNKQKYTEQEISDLQERDFIYRSNSLGISTKGEEFIDEYELKNKQVPSVEDAPVDIENLDALQKNILLILDKPPANPKAVLNKMDQSEIWAEVDDTIANEYVRDDVKTALDVLIGLKLVVAKKFPVEYRLSDDKRTSEIVKQIKNESVENAPEVLLLPSQRNVLKVLYDNYKKFPVANEMNSDSIRIVLEQDNIIYAQNQILKYLEELSDFEFVLQDNDFKGNISWIITPEGVEFFEKLPKTAGQLREEERQKKVKQTGDWLYYDYYLVASILYQSVNMTVTAGIVTAILQSSFKKNPKWDENEILYQLRVLTSLGIAVTDVQNSVDYFEITEFGKDVVKYLIEQENKGLYPKSKPTQKTVAVRPSPTESATLNPVGTIKEGNDGNNWQVRANKYAVKRWVKLK
jgi:predicted transcriptional regulator